ncbi:MAG TPA: DEAD/DEAH box helicase, partial [Conexibacter sp.]|nr:DEAD/DEAH box helicase [Conexibacter sp.]
MTADPVAEGALTLDSPLSGTLGGRTAQALQRAFGYTTAGDLLAHYPRRYALRGELTALAELPLEENVTIVAEVLEVRERTMRSRRGSILEAKISDGTGVLTLTFFNQKWRANELRPGVRGMFAGKVSDYRGARQLAHPQYELFDDEQPATAADAAAVRWATAPIPIYPATAALSSWDLQKALQVILERLDGVEDPLPEPVRSARGLLTHREALQLVHRPEREEDWKAARRTLRFTEAFVLQTALLERRAAARAHEAVRREPAPGGLLERFEAALPFTLTGDQRAVDDEILRDLAQPVPMNRLVQGEVGSGKTVVALRAMLAVAESGGQAALLAPTEVLAAQHLRSIARMLG